MNDFVRIPPDSTGKKVKHLNTVVLQISSLSKARGEIFYGDTIEGETSGAYGTLVGTKLEFDQVSFNVVSVDDTWQVNENILINNEPIGVIDYFERVFTPTSTLTDADTQNHLKITEEGALLATSPEGSQTFDAFGYAQTTGISLVDAHTFIYGFSPERYWVEQINNGTVAIDAPKSLLKLSVDDSPESQASITSNLYYPYIPGEGNFIIFSLALSDEGKEGNTRRWGLFDDNNGLYFENKDGIFSINVRSSTSGTPVDRKYLRNELNGDRLDNPNTSRFILQQSKMNLYWIDYQWLGVGKVRFGMIAPDGKRVVLHTVENANSFNVPYMQSGTLPIRIENINNALTSGVSEIKLVCAAVMRQSDNLEYRGPVFTHNADPEQDVDSTTWKHILSVRPKLTHNSRPNHRTALPTAFDVVVEGDPVRLDQFLYSSLDTPLFTSSPDPRSAFEIESRDSQTFTPGVRVNTIYFPTGVTHRTIDKFFPHGLALSADNVTQPTYTLAVKTVKAGGTSKVTLTLRWQEIE
jgi:hypothetical protein